MIYVFHPNKYKFWGLGKKDISISNTMKGLGNWGEGANNFERACQQQWKWSTVSVSFPGCIFGDIFNFFKVFVDFDFFNVLLHGFNGFNWFKWLFEPIRL